MMCFLFALFVLSNVNFLCAKAQTSAKSSKSNINKNNNNNNTRNEWWWEVYEKWVERKKMRNVNIVEQQSAITGMVAITTSTDLSFVVSSARIPPSTYTQYTKSKMLQSRRWTSFRCEYCAYVYFHFGFPCSAQRKQWTEYTPAPQHI